MSTRAQIGFYADEHQPIATPGTVYVYQHMDGYPEGVLPILLPFACSFHKQRSLGDTAYATARCIVALAQTSGAGDGELEYLGLGATTMLYAGIAYFYHVSPTCIGVYGADSAAADTGDGMPALRLLRAIPISPEPAADILAVAGGTR